MCVTDGWLPTQLKPHSEDEYCPVCAGVWHDFWCQVGIVALMQVVELCETTIGFHEDRSNFFYDDEDGHGFNSWYSF